MQLFGVEKLYLLMLNSIWLGEASISAYVLLLLFLNNLGI